MDVVTGHWKDGRVATFAAFAREPAVTASSRFAEKGIKAVTVGTSFIYRELLKQIVEFFKSGKSPVEASTMLEIVAFIEAANISGANHGAGESIRS